MVVRVCLHVSVSVLVFGDKIHLLHLYPRRYHRKLFHSYGWEPTLTRVQLFPCQLKIMSRAKMNWRASANIRPVPAHSILNLFRYSYFLTNGTSMLWDVGQESSLVFPVKI